MIKRLVVIFFVIPLMLSGQVKVHKVDGNDGFADKQGFYYSLPLTLFSVDITVEKTENFRGPYADYAEKYLGLENVIGSDNNQYRILKIALRTFHTPDPDNYYFAELDEKLIKEGKYLSIGVSDDGILQTYDSQGSLASEGLKAGTDVQPSTSGYRKFGYYAGANRIQVTDTIIRKVVVDTVVSEKMHFNKRWELKSDERKAEEAAAQIQKLRESRLNILTGYQEIPYDAGTIRYMDENLDRIIQDYVSLFTGVSARSQLIYSFTVVPQPVEEDEEMVPVCTFSEQFGLRDLSSTSGTKIFLRMKRSAKTAGLGQSADARLISSKTDKGFYYRIPETVQVSVFPDYGVPVEGWFSINQFGEVTWLPPGVTMLELHPGTGAIKNILLK